MQTPRPLRIIDWARLRVQLLWAYEGVPKYLVWTENMGSTVSAWLLQRGSVRVTETSGDVVAVKGQWILTSGRKLSHAFSDDASIVSVRMRAHWPNGEPLFANDRPVIFPAKDFPQLERAVRPVLRVTRSYLALPGGQVDMLHATAGLSNYMKIVQATHRWFTTYAEVMDVLGVARNQMGQNDSRVIQVLELIDRMPLHMPLDAHPLARGVGLSLAQLNRLFVSEVGLTVKAYNDRRRLRYAQHALQSSNTPVKQIAYVLGFHQPSQFSNWFRKNAKSYPRSFRKTLPDLAQALD